jgi:hypothetical protein
VRYLLHPQVRIRALGNGSCWELLHEDRVIAQFLGQRAVTWRAEPTTVAQEFGIIAQSVALVGRCEVSSTTEIRSELHFGAN